jgi:transposase-like protein
MEHFINIICPNCASTDVCKNGQRKNGTQRWRCNNKAICGRSFQIGYTYNAHKAGVKAQILEQTLNSSGVRDIARNLGIARGTVIADLKKKNPFK